jgi:hypothetical protein
MKKANIKFILLMILLGIIASIQAVAQTGTVAGTVYDSDGGSTLPGANVYLKSDLSFGTVTEVDGSFVLSNVPVGTQVVVISFTGFEPAELTVEVVQGELVKMDATLSPMVYSGAEIIVTAQALGQAKAINQQLNSDAIANFVSAEKIKELPDVNAAEAISRLPGVAIKRTGSEVYRHFHQRGAVAFHFRNGSFGRLIPDLAGIAVGDRVVQISYP